MTNPTSILILSLLVTGAAQEPSSRMTLRGAVQYALVHSPTLKFSEEEITRRQGMVTTARASLMPQLDLSADAVRTRFERAYPPSAEPPELRFDNHLLAVSADLRLLIWDFEKTSLELAATKERVSTARLDFDRRRQEVAFETARLFLQTLTYSDLIGAAEARIASLSAFLDRTRQLVLAGRSVPVEAMKVQTRLAQVESDLASLQGARKASLSELAAVMGMEGDLPKVLYTPARLDLPSSSTEEEEAIQTAGAGRPDLLSQEHDIRASELVESAVRKSALPRIDLRASITHYRSNSPESSAQYQSPVAPTLDGAVTDWLIGLRLSFNLFDGGRSDGQVKTAQAQLGEQRSARQQLKLRVSREVRTAMADLESAESRVRALRDSVAESERVLLNERLKFDAGRSVVEFVLDADAAVHTNQSLLCQAERSVGIAAMALDLAMGRIDVSRLPE